MSGDDDDGGEIIRLELGVTQPPDEIVAIHVTVETGLAYDQIHVALLDDRLGFFSVCGAKRGASAIACEYMAENFQTVRRGVD